jgi:carbonic anhydrase
MLANYLDISEEELAARKVGDPTAAVELDIAALRAGPALPGGLRISGFVYDVATGQIERVVAPPGQAAPQG